MTFFKKTLAKTKALAPRISNLATKWNLNRVDLIYWRKDDIKQLIWEMAMARLRLKIWTTRVISYIPPLPPSKKIAYHVIEYWGFYGIIAGSCGGSRNK
jgi:hypothetical protein